MPFRRGPVTSGHLVRALCYERTRDQGTLGSIAIAIVEPLGGHLFMYLIGHAGEPPRGGSTPTNIT
jgi:hypothetical protein